MTNVPELDRAIAAGQKAVSDSIRRGEGYTPAKADRTYARALVAELLLGMEQEAVLARSYQHGFNAALAEIKRRAGIMEGEG